DIAISTRRRAVRHSSRRGRAEGFGTIVAAAASTARLEIPRPPVITGAGGPARFAIFPPMAAFPRMNFSGATGAWLAFALLFALALAPTVMVDIPVMVDYPNHLARMHILATAGTPDQSPYYQVKWALYPNLAMDLIVPPLGRLVGIEAATRWFL